MTAKKMADIFFGKFSKLIEPQSSLAKPEDKFEKQSSIKKDSAQTVNKTLVYLSIGICLAIVSYYFLA